MHVKTEKYEIMGKPKTFWQMLQKQKYSTILEQCEDDETQRQKMTGHIE